MHDGEMHGQADGWLDRQTDGCTTAAGHVIPDPTGGLPTQDGRFAGRTEINGRQKRERNG